MGTDARSSGSRDRFPPDAPLVRPESIPITVDPLTSPLRTRALEIAARALLGMEMPRKLGLAMDGSEWDVGAVMLLPHRGVERVAAWGRTELLNGCDADFWALPVRTAMTVEVENRSTEPDLPKSGGMESICLLPLRCDAEIVGALVAGSAAGGAAGSIEGLERLRRDVEQELRDRSRAERDDLDRRWNGVLQGALIDAIDGGAIAPLLHSVLDELSARLAGAPVHVGIRPDWNPDSSVRWGVGLPDSLAAALDLATGRPGSGAVETGEPRVWNGSEEGWPEMAPQLREAGLHAAFSRPLIGASGEVMGALTLFTRGAAELSASLDSGVLESGAEGVRSLLQHLRQRRVSRTAEERLSLAISCSRDGFFDYDCERERLSVGPRWCDIVGRDPGTLTWTLADWADHLDPRDAEWVGARFTECLAGGPTFDAEYRIRTSTGETRWIHARGQVVSRDENGPLRMIGTFADTTEQRSRKAEVHRLSAAIRQIRDAVVITDAAVDLETAPVIRFVNPAFEKMVGLAAEQAVGRTTAEILGRVRSELGPIIDARRQLLTGEDTRYTAEFEGPDGGRVWVEIQTGPIEDSDTGQTYWVSIARDVTARVRTERELAESRAQLRHAQKMDAVGRLAGGMAHDFNNLLTAILGYAELIQEDIPSDSSARRDVREVVEAAARGQAITRQLLAFSRKTAWNPTPLSTANVVEGIDNLVDRLLGDDVRLVIIPGVHDGRIRADRHQLEQAIVNLSINARDAMPRGGSVTVSTDRLDLEHPLDAIPETIPPGRYEVISVRDDGGGMEAELIPHIFEPFFTTKQPGKGTGLGLAMVYGTIKQCGGYVSVESTPGTGSAFRLILPRAAIAEAAGVDFGARKAPRGGSETVLVVEDEVQVRNFAVRLLERVGYTVLQAKHGRDALLLWERHGEEIDLVLTDVVMPEMGGVELAEELRLRAPQLRILFMSGYTGGKTGAPERRGGEIDIRDLLHKPFATPDLLERVRERLDRTEPAVP